ncbi:MAG: hypothetical protein SGI88_14065 [Candidatus Hydrogenedentes bacterium]|nr:hypothetical protein [Candidatus Hydrogenedentota bacterium]
MKVLRGRIVVVLLVCAVSMALVGCPRGGRTLLRVDNNTKLGVTSLHIVETGDDSWGKPDIKSIPMDTSCRTIVKGDVVDILVQFATPQPQAKGDCVIYNTSIEIYGWDPTESMHVLALSQIDACTDVYYEFDPEDETDN